MSFLIQPQHALAIKGIRKSIDCAIRHEVTLLADLIEVCRDAWDDYYEVTNRQLTDIVVYARDSDELREAHVLQMQQLLSIASRGTWQRVVRYGPDGGVNRCDASMADGNGAAFMMTYWQRAPGFKQLSDQMIEMEIFLAHRAATHPDIDSLRKAGACPVLTKGMAFTHLEIGHDIYPSAVVESVQDETIVLLCERRGTKKRWSVLTSALTVTNQGDIAAPTDAVEELQA